MAEYNNTRDSSLPDPASPGFQDGDTITLQNGSKFSRQSGRWEPVRFQTTGQQSKEVPVTATLSDQGVVFDEPTTAAIIAIAGDAGGTAQIVDGYPVEVTGTTEVLVSAVPCDVVWIAHNGAAGTITVRDAGVTGTGITAVKTIDMAATATLQPGGLRTQYGVTATLTAGKTTFWVRPL